MIGVATLLAYSAFTSLCLTMNRHHRQVWQGEPATLQRLLLRSCGWALLIASYAVCLVGSGWSLGLVEWFGALSAAGLVLIFLLPYRPRVAAWLGLLTLLLAIVLRLS